MESEFKDLCLTELFYAAKDCCLRLGKLYSVKSNTPQIQIENRQERERLEERMERIEEEIKNRDCLLGVLPPLAKGRKVEIREELQEAARRDGARGVRPTWHGAGG